ncbi:Exported protein of unknown function [Magnetospira sp. QH-2]|nr:Exported protein of unknown function [Magnetospira sp. QH-2]
MIGLALLVGLLSSSIRAQENPPSGPLWTEVPGKTIDLSINTEGQAYRLAPDGRPWRWDAEQQRWRPMSGRFVRISAATGNRPWAIDREGVVFRYNGLWWENKATEVADVGADALGNVYIARQDGRIQKWNPLRSEWRDQPGSAVRIALDTAGHPWIIDKDRAIHFHDGTQWVDLPGRARDIEVNGKDVAVIADGEGRVRTWKPTQGRWVLVEGVNNAIGIAAAPDGGPWAVLANGTIMATTLLVAPEKIRKEEGEAETPKASVPRAREARADPAIASDLQAPPVVAPVPAALPADAAPVQASKIVAKPVQAEAATAQTAQAPGSVNPTIGDIDGGVDPAATSASGDLTFTNTRKSVTQLAIGKDGSVFSLVSGGNLAKWSNSRSRFESFPGSLVRLAVDPDGNPWGISALGRVFRHTGLAWKQIVNATASDLSISSKGDVVAADALGRLYKLNAAMTRFDLISGTNVAVVALAPDGTPWTIRTDKLVQRCDSTPCKVYSQKAISLSVGPDGSVFIVSDINQLMRFDAQKQRFEKINITGHTPLSVAVGPKGYPWVVTSANLALASKFFDRDEAGDRVASIRSTGDTTGSGDTAAVVSTQASGFTFSKNMKFETVSFTALVGGQYALLQSDPDGVIWAYTVGGDLEKYNSGKRKFVDEETTFFSNSYDFTDYDIGLNGDIWAVTSNPTTGIFRERNNALKEYTISSSLTPSDIAVGADGTVYVVVFDALSNYYLYTKGPDEETFTKWSTDTDLNYIAVGPGGDVWMIDQQSYVNQWTGSKFEFRPTNKINKALTIGISDVTGTVYISDDSNVLRKWNGTNGTFDKVNNTTSHWVAVDAEGRPWFNESNTPVIKKARD